MATEDDYERMKLDRSYEEDVWVHLINSRGFAEGNHPTVRGQHLVVRRDGNATVTTEVEDFDPEDFNPEDFDTETEDETRPLYVADHPELMVEVLIPQGEDIAEGAQGPALFGPTESQDIQLHNILHEVHIQPTEKFFARWWPEKEKFVPVGDMDKDAIVKITGSELSNGMYPGAVQKYINGEWTTLYECLVLDLNS